MKVYEKKMTDEEQYQRIKENFLLLTVDGMSNKAALNYIRQDINLTIKTVMNRYNEYPSKWKHRTKHGLNEAFQRIKNEYQTL